MRTFLHHDGALGDVLLSLPCIRKIGEGSAFLHFAGRVDIGKLLVAAGVVQAAASSDDGVFAQLFMSCPGTTAREFLGRFDRAFIFTNRQSSGLAACVSTIIPDTRTVITIPPPGSSTHASRFRLGQLMDLEGEDVHGGFLELSGVVREKTRAILSRSGYDRQRGLVAIHPGSGGKRKCWPLERYLALAARLASGDGPFVVVLSGPAEDRWMKERIQGFATGRAGVAVLPDADLATVAGLLSLCDLFIGNDSGISHLAAAVRCPVIALFGPTDPVVWRPGGGGVRVIFSGSLDALSLEKVYSEVLLVLPVRAGSRAAEQGTFPGGERRERMNDSSWAG